MKLTTRMKVVKLNNIFQRHVESIITMSNIIATP